MKVEKKLIKDVLENILVDNTEVVMDFNEKGLNVKTPDIAINCFLNVNVPKENFTDYSICKYGMDVIRVFGIIKRFNKIIDMKFENNILTFKEGNLEVEIPVMDESAIPKSPNFDVPWDKMEHIEINKETLNVFKEDAKAIVKEDSSIILSNRDNKLIFTSSLDKFKLIRGTEIPLTKELTLKLSPEKLNKHIDVLTTDKVEMWLGTDMPMKIKHGFYEVIMAPREN